MEEQILNFWKLHRIRRYKSDTPGLMEAIAAHLDTILGETLTAELSKADPPEEASTTEAWFDGEWMKAPIIKA